MADWATFAGLVAVVLALLLALSHLTERALTPDDGEPESATNSTPRPPDGTDRPPAEPTSDWPGDGPTDDRSADGSTDDRHTTERTIRASRVPDPPKSGEPNRPAGKASDHPAGSEPFPGADTSGRCSGTDAPEPDGSKSEPDESERGSDEPKPSPRGAAPSGRERRDGTVARIDGRSLSTGGLLANVALTQGLFATLLIGAAIYTGIPADALGIEFTRAYLLTGIALGTVAGIVLYAGNEIGAALAKRGGIDHSEELREMLAPETVRGWLVLLALVLPLVALFEELLFRAALIGVLSTGFGVSPWLLAVLSSIAFALGHGIQGTAGIVVTGSLGFVLAAIFVVTGSLLVVVVAHYVINAFEFVVHEGFEIEWAEAVGG